MMKSFAFLLLPFLADSATTGNRLGARQFDAFYGGAAKAPVKTTKASPQWDKAAIRETVRWGPFMLNPANGSHVNGPLKLDDHSDVVYQQVGGVCNDCMVLWAQSHLQLEDGSEAGISSGVYNHHVIMLDYGRKMIPGPVNVGGGSTAMTPESMIPGLGSFVGSMIPAMSIFVGQGSEGGANTFSPKGNSSEVKSGFYIQKNDKITLLAELVNYNQKPTPVYLALEYEYLPNRPAGYLDVGQFGIATQYINGDLAAIGFKPPHDRSQTYTSPEFPILQEGYLINVAPHLHDGGIDVKLMVNNETVCRSEAIYGGLKSAEAQVGGDKWETITSYTPCEKPIKVKVGDKLKMSSEYDLTKHRLRPQSADQMMEAEGMAIATYMFATKVPGTA